MEEAGYLGKLKDNRQAALESSFGAEAQGPPLRLIVGAWSGKTNPHNRCFALRVLCARLDDGNSLLFSSSSAKQ
jgi:hypothetical protein